MNWQGWFISPGILRLSYDNKISILIFIYYFNDKNDTKAIKIAYFKLFEVRCEILCKRV